MDLQKDKELGTRNYWPDKAGGKEEEGSRSSSWRSTDILGLKQIASSGWHKEAMEEKAGDSEGGLTAIVSIDVT